MIKVIQPGFFTSIQDKGRFGYRSNGVPVSGAMDLYSSHFANALLGNPDDCATLEITMVGPTLQLCKPTTIVISGAFMNPKLNGKPIEMNTIITVKSNDILSFGRVEKGLRCYLAIKEGFKSKVVFNSRSMYTNITSAVRLKKDDIVDYLADNQVSPSFNAHVKFNDSVLENDFLEVFKGPEFDKLSLEQKNAILNKELKVSKFNSRMAYQLLPLVENYLKPILTAPVLPGTVQLTPLGQLIVLMRDCQTTGGYPRILQLTEQSINNLSQKSTGSILKIRLKD
ncbi:biotin-dependent carboxyltransferase family protein [Winogradskyella echinorum]|uniref:Biotin-dependent carboxyltransferase family protein n=1 Tax=Winogradskyella echinorum TaxID=538189 RepID=A0ABR6Y093_9FLAO|nr:biotin-dependent carboxyltransferase family protein [Winogradskyella echinorum]MBC3846177.1 biotin-dependent carboxyltransferase family protein [Winogradskyella echinorum]MBC5750525.1 biotin-dependent carboxyltransferase family protein [Winogradskyella echinorum]